MPDFQQPDWPAPARVKSLQTLRSGGVSVAPWASFNLGDHVGDDPLHVSANRDALTACLPSAPCWLQQVHGTLAVNAENTPKPAVADAAFTRQAGRVCAVMTADCLPVLFCDRAGSVVAAAHAGWRGLAGGVLEQTLQSFRALAPVHQAQDAIDNEAIELIAWLGPCIGPQAFEVGPEVRAAFVATDAGAAACFAAQPAGKYLADLPALARRRLAALGVARVYGNDSSAAWCTVGNPQRYFSFRRDQQRLGGSGRMAACIWRT